MNLCATMPYEVEAECVGDESLLSYDALLWCKFCEYEVEAFNHDRQAYFGLGEGFILKREAEARAREMTSEWVEAWVKMI